MRVMRDWKGEGTRMEALRWEVTLHRGRPGEGSERHAGPERPESRWQKGHRDGDEGPEVGSDGGL